MSRRGFSQMLTKGSSIEMISSRRVAIVEDVYSDPIQGVLLDVRTSDEDSKTVKVTEVQLRSSSTSSSLGPATHRRAYSTTNRGRNTTPQ
jgi:hypothetical protein